MMFNWMFTPFGSFKRSMYESRDKMAFAIENIMKLKHEREKVVQAIQNLDQTIDYPVGQKVLKQIDEMITANENMAVQNLKQLNRLLDEYERMAE